MAMKATKREREKKRERDTHTHIRYEEPESKLADKKESAAKIGFFFHSTMKAPPISLPLSPFLSPLHFPLLSVSLTRTRTDTNTHTYTHARSSIIHTPALRHYLLTSSGFWLGFISLPALPALYDSHPLLYQFLPFLPFQFSQPSAWRWKSILILDAVLCDFCCRCCC